MEASEGCLSHREGMKMKLDNQQGNEKETPQGREEQRLFRV
jgi:hypothetical protein